jgi:crotonobetainyl-CoA:carnitine CoA-transferase CaiB-like acyl-CoA transferase
VPVKHPRLPDYRALGLPIRWDGERPPITRVPPLLGEHTAEVLAELGFAPDAIEDLARRHVVGL